MILDAYVESRRGKASFGSIKATCGGLRKHFGQLKPQHITQPLVNGFALERKRQGKSNSTIYTDCLFLRAAVNWAIGQKTLPAEAKLTFEMPVRRSKAREDWRDKDEARRIIDSAKAPHIRLFLAIGFMTGHRREAILSLRWSPPNDPDSLSGWVDMKARRINFGVGTENKRRAVVPINDFLFAELERARDVATTPWVIEYGGDRVRDVRRGLEEACKRAGVPRITPHVMRHSAATWLAMSPDISMREAARLLGMSEAIFERVYGKHRPDFLNAAASALSF
ncbi:MAG: site-specific integrase [Caenispirillum bisanense]|nr:site-specific integrase [Caenispirillum bisanense]